MLPFPPSRIKAGPKCLYCRNKFTEDVVDVRKLLIGAENFPEFHLLAPVRLILKIVN